MIKKLQYYSFHMNNKLSKIAMVFIFFIVMLSSDIVSQSLLDPDAQVEEIATGILQPEGPVWKDNIGLLFSDIKGNKIYKWTAETGKQIYINPSDSTNGLTYDSDGMLVAGQMGLRRIVRFENDGKQVSLAERYNGKRFSSPNDLIVKSNGDIFFTDPDFNIPKGQNKELEFNGIYRINTTGNIQLLAKLTLPNGICFSPDEKILYVNDSQAHKIYKWDIVDDSTITNKELFYTIPVNGYADGMKADTDGNIYCTCSSAVWVISPSGELIGKIDLPNNVSASNCTWGEEDNRTLFITAGSSVFRVRPLVSSVNKYGSISPKKMKLFQNYPNPFNPITNIKYYLPVRSHVSLVVNDILGEVVTILFDGVKQAGKYNDSFDGSGLSSGIYFYKLTADNYVNVKKLLLLK